MTQSTAPARPFRRAMVLVTASSALVPAAGVLTSPMLAHALGVEGRGELAVVLAPSSLAVAVATLGLPDALTYYVAKHPRITGRGLGFALALSALVGLLCLLASAVALPFLSTGDDRLGKLILLATALVVPTLAIGVIRGAAIGHQMWTAVAVERVVGTLLRVVLFAVLILVDDLTVFTAMLISQVSSLVAGAAYWRLWSTARAAHEVTPFVGNLRRAVVSFGVRVWLGSVAEMVLARTAQLVIGPLSNVAEVGLYTVAVTISDVPLIVALAVRDALYGLNSKAKDAGQVAATSRVAILIAAVNCLCLGGTLPLWLGLVFGEQFVAATAPTLILMVSATICIPGMMAAAGLSAWGRPGLNSIGMVATVVSNLLALVILVPVLGAVGAACAGLIANVVLTTYMVTVAARVLGVRPLDFVLVRPADVVRVRSEVVGFLRRRRRQSTDQA
jgi:O-antigen/teichoic acid export membrane protein